MAARIGHGPFEFGRRDEIAILVDDTHAAIDGHGGEAADETAGLVKDRRDHHGACLIDIAAKRPFELAAGEEVFAEAAKGAAAKATRNKRKDKNRANMKCSLGMYRGLGQMKAYECRPRTY